MNEKNLKITVVSILITSTLFNTANYTAANTDEDIEHENFQENYDATADDIEVNTDSTNEEAAEVVEEERKEEAVETEEVEETPEITEENFNKEDADASDATKDEEILVQEAEGNDGETNPKALGEPEADPAPEAQQPEIPEELETPEEPASESEDEGQDNGDDPSEETPPEDGDVPDNPDPDNGGTDEDVNPENPIDQDPGNEEDESQDENEGNTTGGGSNNEDLPGTGTPPNAPDPGESPQPEDSGESEQPVQEENGETGSQTESGIYSGGNGGAGGNGQEVQSGSDTGTREEASEKSQSGVAGKKLYHYDYGDIFNGLDLSPGKSDESLALLDKRVNSIMTSKILGEEGMSEDDILKLDEEVKNESGVISSDRDVLPNTGDPNNYNYLYSFMLILAGSILFYLTKNPKQE